MNDEDASKLSEEAVNIAAHAAAVAIAGAGADTEALRQKLAQLSKKNAPSSLSGPTSSVLSPSSLEVGATNGTYDERAVKCAADGMEPEEDDKAGKAAAAAGKGGRIAGQQQSAYKRCVLEDFTRCSESHLWKLMMSFYDRKGVESWSQGIVPHFITCNAFIGRSYAHVLYSFLRDCMSSKNNVELDTNEPLYIIELGTGSGKFSFFMLKALQEMKDISDFPVEKIVYVMTDFTEANFKYWVDHPSLKPFIETGQLEMAIFDAVNDKTVTLSRSGVQLGPGTVKNPICIVANYLFDTLCHDVFQVDGGVLKEGLISVGSTREEEPDPLDPEIIKRFDNKFEYRPISEDYYSVEEDSKHLKRILRWYLEAFGHSSSGGSILLPIGALRALRQLFSFSNNRAVVISGDKGNNNPEQFRGLMDPHIAVHGSFSVMVNYHAIGAYFTSRGGFALHNPQEEASLKVSCFVLTGDEEEDGDTAWNKGSMEEKDAMRGACFPHLSAAFKTNVEQFGPNDFFVMQKCLKEDAPTPTLKSIVALLKLGDWDPDVFYKFRDNILNQVPTASQKLRKDLCRGIPRVWANYYILDKDKDVAFEIGRFHYGIRDYRSALTFYEDSSRNIGEHHVTYHNMGLCHYSLGNLHTSLDYFEKALNLNDKYEKARNWKSKVLQELELNALGTIAVNGSTMLKVPDSVDSTASSNGEEGDGNDKMGFAADGPMPTPSDDFHDKRDSSTTSGGESPSPPEGPPHL